MALFCVGWLILIADLRLEISGLGSGIQRIPWCRAWAGELMGLECGWRRCRCAGGGVVPWGPLTCGFFSGVHEVRWGVEAKIVRIAILQRRTGKSACATERRGEEQKSQCALQGRKLKSSQPGAQFVSLTRVFMPTFDFLFSCISQSPRRASHISHWKLTGRSSRTRTGAKI